MAQCQASLEAWDIGAAGLAIAGEARCTRRVVAVIENKRVCRVHLAAALRRLRGETDSRAMWWEIQAAEALGSCYFCGTELRRRGAVLPVALGAPAAFEPCTAQACLRERTAAYLSAIEAEDY